MAKMRKVTVVQGTGEFADPYHLKVVLTNDGSTQTDPVQAAPSSPPAPRR